MTRVRAEPISSFYFVAIMQSPLSVHGPPFHANHLHKVIEKNIIFHPLIFWGFANKHSQSYLAYVDVKLRTTLYQPIPLPSKLSE